MTNYTFINKLLEARGMGSFEEYLKDIETLQETERKLEEATNTVSSLRSEVARLSLSSTTSKTVEVKKSGAIPEGKLVHKPVTDLFPEITVTQSFDVPCWEWDGDHPAVPEAREGYVFREELVMPILYSLIFNERCWLQGHTGAGKTTLYEQIASRLNWPFLVINFDSEVTRLDLVGQTELIADGSGSTESRFVDGILPQALSGPYIVCLDEIDFIRPDVAYVMQRVLEGEGLRILEDNGREVIPHEMCRLVATGNTVGQGDETGAYVGARPQSAAFLNRFTSWVEVPYLSTDQVNKYLGDVFPQLESEVKGMLLKYFELHKEAFLNHSIVQPISPRTFNTLAKKTMFYTGYGARAYDAFRKAVEDSVLSACNQTDRQTLAELLNRVA